MKILQILPSLAAGGAEGFVVNLGVSFAELGVDVRFFLLGGARGERGDVLLRRLCAAGIEVVGAENRKPASLRNLLRLAGLMRSWKPDVVQANLYPSEVACVAARALTVGNKSCCARRLANTEFCAYRSRWITKRLDGFFPLVVACSDAVADSYRAFMKGKQKSQITVIPNGGLFLDSVPDEQAKLEARRALGIPETAFVVAHIGRMTPGGKSLDGGLETGQKAHDVLLKAFAKAFKDDQDAVLLLVGDGPLRPDIQALAGRLGVESRVVFLGQQPEPWPALKASDIFCFPSRYEGLPNVLPEAASCGLPVVASDIPEIRSLYPGEAWVLAQVDNVLGFADAMLKVCKDFELFAERARNTAWDFRERFSMKTCAEKYLQAYKLAIDSKK